MECHALAFANSIGTAPGCDRHTTTGLKTDPDRVQMQQQRIAAPRAISSSCRRSMAASRRAMFSPRSIRKNSFTSMDIAKSPEARSQGVGLLFHARLMLSQAADDAGVVPVQVVAVKAGLAQSTYKLLPVALCGSQSSKILVSALPDQFGLLAALFLCDGHLDLQELHFVADVLKLCAAAAVLLPLFVGTQPPPKAIRKLLGGGVLLFVLGNRCASALALLLCNQEPPFRLILDDPVCGNIPKRSRGFSQLALAFLDLCCQQPQSSFALLFGDSFAPITSNFLLQILLFAIGRVLQAALALQAREVEAKLVVPCLELLRRRGPGRRLLWQVWLSAAAH
eukprot:s2969_g2.t2